VQYLIFNYSNIDYSLGEELKELGIQGDTQIIGMGLSYPIMRSRDLSLWSNMNYNYRATYDLTLDKPTEQRFINQYTLGLESVVSMLFGWEQSINLATCFYWIILKNPISECQV
jgi:hemolysin activation/secretion protein